MLLCEKLKLLRNLEGNLRGLDRPLTKSEISRMIQQELGVSISQAYLSQLEAGKRVHMTARSRELLARFYKVHPGYLVDDPEGFRTEPTAIPVRESQIDEWLLDQAEEFARSDSDLADALRTLAKARDTRRIIMLMARLAAYPEVVKRLEETLC